MPEQWRQPFASSPGVRRRMQRLPRQDTRPELSLRRSLHGLGLRYRVHTRPLETLNRRADIVFRREAVAVFVDGCFWHGCPEHRRAHRTNEWYWLDKIERNKARDVDTGAQLTSAGWFVFRVWEHEEMESAAGQIAQAVRSRRPRDGLR